MARLATARSKDSLLSPGRRFPSPAKPPPRLRRSPIPAHRGGLTHRHQTLEAPAPPSVDSGFRVPVFLMDFGLNTTAFMLGEVQGWANLFRGMPWRIGWTESPSFYTCDNPISGFSTSVCSPWDWSLITSRSYHFPISTNVAIWFAYTRRFKAAWGSRECRPFSPWEVSFTKQVVTSDATRYLYGPGPYVDRRTASRTLSKINASKLIDAVALQGFSPTFARPSSPTLRALLGDRAPEIDKAGILKYLDFYLQRIEPVSTLLHWVDEIYQFGESHIDTKMAHASRELCLAIAACHAGRIPQRELDQAVIRMLCTSIRSDVRSKLQPSALTGDRSIADEDEEDI